MRNEIAAYYGALFAVAATTAVYFWPIGHSGMAPGDLQAWVATNSHASTGAYTFPVARAIDEAWKLPYGIPIVKFLQLLLLTLNGLTFAWVIRRLTGSLPLAVIAPLLLLCTLEVRLTDDALIGTSLKYQVVTEAGLLAFAQAARFRRSGAAMDLLSSLTLALIAAFTLPAGMILAALFSGAIVRKPIRYRHLGIAVSFIAVALSPVLMSEIHTGVPNPGFAGPPPNRMALDLVEPIPTYYRAFGGLTSDRFSTQFNYDDRFSGFPDVPLSGDVVAIVGALLLWMAMRSLPDHNTKEDQSDLLTLGAVFVIAGAGSACVPITTPHLARVAGAEAYLCSFGLSSLAVYALGALSRRSAHHAFRAALPAMTGFLCFFILIGNARANSLVFWHSKIESSSHGLLQQAAEMGLFNTVPTGSTLLVPHMYPFSAMGVSEQSKYIFALTGRSYAIARSRAINAHGQELWELDERYGRKWPSSVAVGRVSAFRRSTPLVDHAIIYLARPRFRVSTIRKRGITVHATTLRDRGQILNILRTCSPTPLASVLAPEHPSVTWGPGFVRPEGYARLLFARSYSLKSSSTQSWRYAGRTATLNVSWSTTCRPAPVVLTARIYTAVPGEVVVSAPGVSHHAETTSQVGKYLRIKLPAKTQASIPVNIATRASMPERDTLAPRYMTMQNVDIRMLVMNVSAGFIDPKRSTQKTHGKHQRP